MKVAIDVGPLNSGHAVRGIGVHTRELIEELKNLETDDVDIEPVDFSTTDLSKYEIAHYQYFHPYFLTLPFQKPAKKVIVTIHDLIPLIYPKRYPGGFKGNLRFWLQRFLIRNVDAIITISETSKKDICRFLGVYPDKVHVVYLAPKSIFKKLGSKELEEVKKKYDLPKKFVLYVGDINYNKNIPRLIRACKVAGTPLVICGKQALDVEEEGGDDLRYLSGPMDWIRYVLGIPHPELAHFRDLLREFKKAKVLRLGFVPDRDLVAIYNLASVYCQPSFYEGFGLPVLEAFACGCPVVAARTQALVEIGDGGALFANPKDVGDLANQLKMIHSNVELRNQLVNKGREIVKKYSWKKTAAETLRLYRSLAYE